MSTSPDAQVIYDQAIALEERVEQHNLLGQEWRRKQRDLQLDLLADGYLPDAPPEIRLAAIGLRAEQLLEEAEPETYKKLEAETCAIQAMRARNEAIVAAGWAESFSMNRWSRSLTDQTQKDIEG